MPTLKAKLRKVSGSSRKISSLAQSAESQSPESPTPFARNVGESRSRLSKLSYEKLAEVLGKYHRWPKAPRVRVPNLQHRFPETLESQGADSQS